MLDIKFMRENRETVLDAMRALAAEDAPVAQALALDERRRAILVRVEVLRAERNSGSKQIGQLMREGKRAEGQALQAHMSDVGDEIKTLDEELTQVEANLQDAMLRIPNLPHPSVPVGASDAENVIVREEGQPRAFDFEPLPHWDLGTKLDIIDFDRGVKLSGTRFYVLKGAGARFQRALITWMLDLHTQKHGYTEVLPPYMVKAEMLVGTGNLPKFGDNLYRDAEEDYWWIPTAEVPVTNLYRDEILDGDATADQARGLHRLLPPREDELGPRRPRHQARAPVRQGRDGQVRPAGDLDGRTDEAGGQCRGRLPRAGHPLPADPDVHRRSELLGRGQVRSGAVGAGLRRVA